MGTGHDDGIIILPLKPNLQGRDNEEGTVQTA